MTLHEEGDPFEALVDQQFDAEPYSGYRARGREALAGSGWVCRDSDDESDYFLSGRWLIYTSPADQIFEFNSIVIFEFATPEDAEMSLCEDPGEPEPILTREFTVHDALRHVDERDHQRTGGAS